MVSMATWNMNILNVEFSHSRSEICFKKSQNLENHCCAFAFQNIVGQHLHRRHWCFELKNGRFVLEKLENVISMVMERHFMAYLAM